MFPSLPAVTEFTNALTVDVEDYFQVSAFSERVSRSMWSQLECRVETSTDLLLSIFDRHSVRATFFVLGWVADRYPKLLRRIANAGHEVASHGYWHQLIYDLTPEEFAKDVVDSQNAIANAIGERVSAYRAPSFSIVEKSYWALEILAENGFRVDSSVFPIRGHDRYGLPDAPQEIHEVATDSGSLIEFPPSAWTHGRFCVPIGGGYFRLFPLKLTSRAINAVQASGRPAMFYTHPWEFDPGQPIMDGLKWKTRFRHYVGLERTVSRLNRLLQRHRFGTMSEVIEEVQRRRREKPA